MGFRESISEEALRASGLDPKKYEVEVPLHRRLSFKRETVHVGEQGTFSTGTTERTKDSVLLSLNPRGSFSILQDHAEAVGPSGFVYTESTQRTMSLRQGLGGGKTAGEFSFARVEDQTRDALAGRTRSEIDTAKLNYGLGSRFSMASALTTTSKLDANDLRSQQFDVSLSRAGQSAATAEYHTTESVLNGATTTLRTMALRTPTIELGDASTVTASHARSDSSVKGTEAITSIGLNAQASETVKLAASHVGTSRDTGVSSRVTSLSVDAKPDERVSVAASHIDTERNVGGDDTVSTVTVNATPVEGVSVNATHTDADRGAAVSTNVTTLGSQITLLPHTTLSASFSDTQTQGAGVATRRSFSLDRTPEGEGFGVKASYTTLGHTGGNIAPTVDLMLQYTTASALQFTGTYHDEDNRPEPEIGAAVKVPLFGANFDLNFHEYSYDAKKKTVYQQRVWNAELAREIAWGMSGKLGYSLDDSLIDPTQVSRVRIGLGGENPTVGKLDLAYETGKLHTASGNTPNGSIISVGVTRGVGVADVSVSAKRTLPPGSAATVKPHDEIHLDVKAAW